MDKLAWRIVTALRHSPIHLTSAVPTCEYCNSPALYSSSLMDEQEAVREVHWHCKGHQNPAVEALEHTKYEGLRSVIRERHWMHIWRVGRVACKRCPNDSRVVVSLLNDASEVVEQMMFCDRHAPAMDDTMSNDPYPGNIVDDVMLGLGASFTVDTD